MSSAWRSHATLDASGDGRRRRAALDRSAAAGPAEHLSVLEHQLAAAEGRVRPGAQLAARVDAVARARKQVGVPDDPALARLPYRDVGVGPDRDRSLARVHAEQ